MIMDILSNSDLMKKENFAEGYDIFNGDTKFWRVLGYLPNLGYGKNKSNKTPTVKKIQDEHDCLSCVFESVRMIHRNGGVSI
jgi:hypothetical protein